MSADTDPPRRDAMLGPLQGWLRRTLSDPQIVLLLILIALAAALASLVGALLAPVVASVVIAYLLEGPARFLVRCGFSRAFAASLLTIAFVAGLVAALFVLLPILLGQVAQFARGLPVMFATVQRLLLELPGLYPELFNRQQVEDFAANLNRDVIGLGQELLLYSVSQLPTLATVAIYLFILPLLVFFFIKDKRAIEAWAASFLPEERPLANLIWDAISVKLGGYVRGKVYEIAIVAIVTYVAFAALGLNFAALLAVLSGLSVLIPYFGAPMVAAPIAMSAFSQWGIGPELLYVMIAYAIIQTIDGTVLSTLLLAGTVDLHPIAVIVAILIFGDLYGFWGVFFAVPLAAVAQVIVEAWPRRAPPPPE